MKLEIDLVPRTSFFKNLRSELSAKDWDKVRKSVYKEHDHKCQICGGVGKKHLVECHEIWQYDWESKTQTLVGLECLCPKCHSVKHWGLSQIQGKEGMCVEHIKAVNGISHKEMHDYIIKSFEIWRERSSTHWALDISYIHQYLKNID